MQLVRLGDFGIVLGDGGAGDDDFGAGNIFRAVTFKGNRSQAR
jgi:hypothetical protein